MRDLFGRSSELLGRGSIMVPMEWDVAIIGGGAAGLAAAVTAAEAGARVCVLEASDRVGRSILASGNGRCNFSNAHICADAYHNAAFVAEALAAFEQASGVGDEVSSRRGAAHDSKGSECDEASDGKGSSGIALPGLCQEQAMRGCPNGVVAFFQRHGLAWREESEGRLYPLANKASAVLEVLRAALDAHSVEVRCNARVNHVEAPQAPGALFVVQRQDDRSLRARTVVVAVGGTACASMLADLFPFAPLRPMLGSIATKTRPIRRLDNIRAKGTISLLRDGRTLACERGEIMFRSYGVSGIAAFNLSRLMQAGDTLLIDFLGQLQPDAEDARVLMRQRAHDLRSIYGKGLTCADALRGLVLPAVARAVADQAGMRLDALADDAALGVLAATLSSFQLEVRGIGDERTCQVHRGGFAVRAFTPATLEAKDVLGLHVVGEALDVDAPCGGYNLHWAFATGILAGRAAAARVYGDGQDGRPHRVKDAR